MANPSAVSFWLDNRQVNGTMIAENDGEKLVKYGQKFYVVVGKDPSRRHFTKSSLPPKWKQILSNGGAPPSPSPPTAKVEAVPALVEKKKVKASRAAQREKSPEVSAHPELTVIPAGTPPEGGPTVDTSPSKAESPVKKRAPKAEKVKVADPGNTVGALPVPREQPVKQASRGKAALGVKEQETVASCCPYCQKGFEAQIVPVQLLKPYFVVCGSCSKQFAVRILSKTIYLVEVAAFPD